MSFEMPVLPPGEVRRPPAVRGRPTRRCCRGEVERVAETVSNARAIERTARVPEPDTPHVRGLEPVIYDDHTAL